MKISWYSPKLRNFGARLGRNVVRTGKLSSIQTICLTKHPGARRDAHSQAGEGGKPY